MPDIPHRISAPRDRVNHDLAIDLRLVEGVGFAHASGTLGFEADACELVLRRGDQRWAAPLERIESPSSAGAH